MPQLNTPINTNDQSLDRVLQNPLPVMLILSAGPVDPATQPVLDQIARAESGKLIVAKVNTTDNPVTAQRFQTLGGTRLVTWKTSAEQVNIEYPTPDQIRAAADHLLGRGPAPRTVKPQQTQANADGHPLTVNEASFDQQVLRSAEPVLVDFWAPWCGPCRMIAPTLEKFSREYAGKLRIAKLNVDENPRLAAQYGAHSIPLLILFKGGKPVQQLVGAYPEPNLRSFVENAIR